MRNLIYLGRVRELVNNKDYKKDEWVVKVDIPEINENLLAFPLYHTDAPVVDDEVVLFNMNPNLDNVFLYLPLKKFNGENPFNGFRSNGTKVEIHPDGKVSISNEKDSLYDVIKSLIQAVVSLKTVGGEVLDIRTRVLLNNAASKLERLMRER